MSAWPEAVWVVNNTKGGIVPDNMAMLSVTAGDQKITIKFTDPADTTIDGKVISTWKGTKVLIKAGSDPIENENDGTLLVDNTKRGKYTSEGIVVNNLTNGQPYTVAAFPYSTQGAINLSQDNQRTVSPEAYILLGFKIDKNDSNPATRVHYTEGAEGMTPASMNLSTGAFNYGSFGSMWFVTGNKPVMLKSDGTEDYELDPDDYTKKAAGGSSDVANTSYDGNAMARIPVVWIKQWEDSQYEYCNFCNIQLDENYHAYAHTREDGSVADVVYLAMFKGGLVSNKLRSLKGLSHMNGQTGTNEITYARANGTKWYTRSWSQINLLWMLLILMGRSTDVQGTFGNGHYTGGPAASSLLTAGTISDKGQFYGTSGNVAHKVFHIENLWGNQWERIAGLMLISGVIHTKMVPGYNITGAGYTNTGITMGGTNGGYISKQHMTDNGWLPETMSGSETTYTPDGGWFASGTTYAFVGGSCGDGLRCGCAVGLIDAVSHSSWSIGAALSCEQPAA